MQLKIEKSFEKDVFKIQDKALLKKIEALIHALIETESLQNISHVKKLKGYRAYYRIRIGDYRLGLELENNTLV